LAEKIVWATILVKTKEIPMLSKKLIASSAALLGLLSSQALAWSISGTVMNSDGALAGVKVNTFNIGGYETTSNEAGQFSLSSDNPSGLFGVQSATSMTASLSNGIFSLSNVNAHQLKISVIDALGKVTYQRSFYEMFGTVSIDLSKVAGHGAKFVRVAKDGASQTYMMKGKNALLKEGDLLPVLQFSKDGYANAVYQMKSEVEENVIIQMHYVPFDGPEDNSSSSVAKSSSSIAAPKSSSSVEAPKSSSSVEETTDCSGKSYAAGDHKMSVNVDGKNRTFIMHVPSAYKGTDPVPLVVDYHPIGGSGQGELSSSPYKGKTDPEGVITLYPDGTGGKSMMGAGWNVGPCCSNDDDVKFSREMIKAVEEKVCINKKRVYATGFSMGGGMSNHVACFMSDVYAAVAPAAMDLNKTNSAQCNPDRPVPIIMFRGTADNVCRYQGGDSGFNDGLNFLGAEGNFNFWKEKNGCTGAATTNSNGCQEYSNCRDGVKVILCTKQGGGHDYGDANIGWPFLKSFTLP
jgi:polyhydroxybutyrate depolymerase